MKLLVVANCQGAGIKLILEADNRHNVDHEVVHTVDTARLTPEFLGRYDAVIAQDIRPDRIGLWQAIAIHPRVIHFPWLVFYGLTPDHSTMNTIPGQSAPPLDNIPRIMAAARTRGLTPEQTRALYNPEFIDAMGYRSDFGIHRNVFIQSLSRYSSRAEYLFERWFDRGVFFYTANHPCSFVVEDVLREVLGRQDIVLPTIPVSDFLPDPLAKHAIHPNLNHPAAHNLLTRADHVYKQSERLIPLRYEINNIFRQLGEFEGQLQISDRDLARFDAAYTAWTGRAPEPLRNPYKDRTAAAFWSHAVARPAPRDVFPGDAIAPVIGKTTRVATAGSCFAQHVARAMVGDGLNYYVAETAPDGMSEDMAQAQGYGLFSARYGNIYSTRQLLQLIRRAYGGFTPVETAWAVEGGFIDPFRPNIGEVFASVEAMEAARAAHLAKVREMFESLDVFVFTLGLTEGWFDRRDGAAYPVTPGAVTKSADPAHFEFQNHDYGTIKADLIAFLGELFAVNPGAKVIFTVSPVPLIATYGAADVLSATTYSKSVLRAVAGDVADRFDAVQYFPSYEIITGAYNRGAYFGADLREIRPEGVAHVMDVFRQRLVIGAGAVMPQAAAEPGDRDARAAIADEMQRQQFVVCDEELLVGDD